MWKTKKGILLMVLLVCVLLAGGVAGAVAFAQSGSSNESQTTTQEDTILNKVVQIYQKNTGITIDAQQLKTAFAQAQSEMRDEALQNRLNSLVKEGKITQEEADAYLSWWDAKPDTQIPGDFGPCFGGMMDRGPGHFDDGRFPGHAPDVTVTPDTSGSGL